MVELRNFSRETVSVREMRMVAHERIYCYSHRSLSSLYEVYISTKYSVQATKAEIAPRYMNQNYVFTEMI
jgi:hypothetical protein